MIVLLDEAVPHKLRTALTGHDVSTTAWRGWSGLKNGALLRTAEEAGVQVIVTCDQNIPDQQTLAGRPFGVVVLTKQEWPKIRRHLTAIQATVDQCSPGAVVIVNCDGTPGDEDSPP